MNLYGLVALTSGIGALLLIPRSAQAASTIQVGPATPEDIKRTSWWADHDFIMLDLDAIDLKMNAPDYLLMMAAESKLDPAIKNPLSGATGLNQLTSAANWAAGITEDFRVNQFHKLSVAEQLPYVKKYFMNQPWTKAGLKYDHAGQVWQSNFAPGTMLSKGTGLDVVMYPGGGKAYEWNKGLDTDKKGYITVRDLVRHLKAISETQLYKSALARLRSATGQNYSPNLPGV